jgi:DNA-binding NtrC family response regulator
MTDTGHVILIVDDEEGLREGLRMLLEGEGYTVVSAEAGEEALQILQQSHIDLVVTDMRMPGMNGIELLKNIRQRYGDLGVIILTGYGQIESYIEAMNFGAIEYVSKPFKVDELKFIVNKVLHAQKE